MLTSIENETRSILNNNDESEIQAIKNNFKVIDMKRVATDYVASFNSFAIKTAQSTLEMCRVVYEAKSDLEAKDFEKFCEAIARSHEDSTIRKYLAIGARHAEFIAYADRMPNSWTSIYLITTIPSDKFLQMINEAKSLKNLTAQQIKKLISDESTTNEKKKDLIDNPAVSIYFTRSPTVTEWNTLKLAIKNLEGLEALNVRLDFSEKFERNYEKSKKENAASAKLRRQIQKESQKKVDEQDLVYNHMFDYGDAYDFALGKFIA
jgi:hypothetical protein